jgi:hypothetical protein
VTTLRDARREDFAAILALNAESVHFLSPLTAERLDALHRAAAYHKIIEIDGEVAAFLLAFREGAPYDSPNYLWFAERYPEFLYIDRIVVLLFSLRPIIFLSIASSVATSSFPRLFHINSCRLYFVMKINRSNLAGP